MRKIAASLSITLAALMLTACGGNKTGQASSEPASETQAQTETEDVSAEPGSWAPLATVRERDIVSTDDEYDYEIVDGGASITSYKGSDTEVVIPDTIGGAPVTSIGFYAFEAKDQLLTVTMPETVTKICECAFCGCTSLYSINIPQGMQEIQRGAFVDCTALTDMTIPASVTKVGEETFTGCTSLASLNIENPDLAYESWGLEELPSVWVSAPEGSAASVWADKINSGEAEEVQ